MSEITVFVLVVLGIVLVAAAVVVGIMAKLNSAVVRNGHRSFGAYIRTTPRNDAEKRDAIDMALGGLVLCIIGMVLSPIFLLGLYPFYYGARKVAYSSLGVD